MIKAIFKHGDREISRQLFMSILAAQKFLESQEYHAISEHQYLRKDYTVDLVVDRKASVDHETMSM